MSPAISEVDCGGDIFQARASALAFLLLASECSLYPPHVGVQQVSVQYALADEVAGARHRLSVSTLDGVNFRPVVA